MVRLAVTVLGGDGWEADIDSSKRDSHRTASELRGFRGTGSVQTRALMFCSVSHTTVGLLEA